MNLMQRSLAELIGTFWLVLGGCGSAVLAAGFPDVGIGLLGVSFAFGLTVLTMVYAIGHISGCHLNPAVSVGLAVSGRFSWTDLPVYVVAQVIGAVLAAYSALVHRRRCAGLRVERQRAGREWLRRAVARQATRC
jgi:aquaporin Z